MIKLIVAVSTNNVIGVGNRLPWHLPQEMAHFKAVTMGETVVMGRKTWESIPEKYRPLVGRRNIVIGKGVVGADEVFQSLDELLKVHDDFIVIGGAALYDYFLTCNLVDEIIMTVVHQVVPPSPENVFLTGLDITKFQRRTSTPFQGFEVSYYGRVR